MERSTALARPWKVYIYANNDVYEGGWKDGWQHGSGRRTYANGDSYERAFKNGRRHGRGKMTYKNGYVKDGRWISDFFKGSS